MALNRPIPPSGPGSQPPKAPVPKPPPIKPPVPPPKLPVEDEPISLVEPTESVEIDAGSSDSTMGIRPMGSGESAVRRAITSTLDYDKRTQFKRKAVNTGKGAIRCRVFHSKVAESSIAHMENQINTWLDDEEIDVKHVGHMVGAMEGKHTEPNIIVFIWY
jgi:hypothetical protein